ncbi:hypothetical protein ACHAWF_017723 [Thalassiosira exigua]
MATVDISGAFLHTDVNPNDDTVHMVLRGTLEELMARELHGNAKSNLWHVEECPLVLFEARWGSEKKTGIKLNPYDPCVANKTVSGSQLAVIWHVDNLKISHKNLKVVTKFISYLIGIYPGVTVHRGCVHEYFGMTLYYSTPKEVHVSMTNYLIKVVKNLEAILSVASTPAGE